MIVGVCGQLRVLICRIPGTYANLTNHVVVLISSVTDMTTKLQPTHFCMAYQLGAYQRRLALYSCLVGSHDT